MIWIPKNPEKDEKHKKSFRAVSMFLQFSGLRNQTEGQKTSVHMNNFRYLR